MESFFLTLFSDALISGTLAFIAVIIPFSGALWMYRKGIGANAEIAIFQIGRDIATELRSASEMTAPLTLYAEHHIDEKIQELDELNRDLAIHELLVNAYHVLLRESDSKKCSDCANTIIAITTSRFENLVPQGVRWSGRGPVYDVFGEEIPIGDNLFPFGTKLYRKWIEEFSMRYNDLWASTGSFIRKDLVKSFGNSYGWTEENVDKWLDHVAETIARLSTLHSKLITQIQIIDNSVNERYFAFNLLACSPWIILLFAIGYVGPVFLVETEALGLLKLAALFVSALVIIGVVVYRIIVKSHRHSDFYEQRQALLPTFLQALAQMRRGTANLKRDRLSNVLSLRHELHFPQSLCALLRECVELTDAYNRYVDQLSTDVSDLLDDLVSKFPTEKANIGGFGLALPEVVDQEFDFDSICKRIVGKEEQNLYVQSRFQSSSRDSYIVNLTDLNADRRVELAAFLSDIRSRGQKLESYQNYDASWSRLAEKLELLKDSVNELLKKSHFDLVARWANAKPD